MRKEIRELITKAIAELAEAIERDDQSGIELADIADLVGAARDKAKGEA